MKLKNLKNLIEKMPELDENWANTYNAARENPSDIALQRKHALAVAQWKRAIKTVQNYKPVLTVKLGQFCDCAKEVFDAMGYKSELTCFDFHTNAVGKTQANLFLTLSKGKEEQTYNLFKVVLEDENQPLADVKINLLRTGTIKGVIKLKSHEELEEALNTISWNAITKTILASIEEKKIAKAIKEEEKGIN